MMNQANYAKSQLIPNIDWIIINLILNFITIRKRYKPLQISARSKTTL